MCDHLKQSQIVASKSRMDESEVKKEYDELQAVYSRKRSECDTLERQIPIFRNEIDELKSRIKECETPPPKQTSLPLAERAQQDKQALVREHVELSVVLNRVQLQSQQPSDSHLSELRVGLNSLQSASQAFVFAESSQDFQKASAMASAFQGKVEAEELKIKHQQNEIDNAQNTLQALEREIVAFEELKSRPNLGSSPNVDLCNFVSELEKLEAEEAALTQEVKAEETHFNERKSHSEGQDKARREELEQLKAKNTKLKSTQTQLQDELLKTEAKPEKAPLEDEARQLQELKAGVSKEIEAIYKQIAEKKHLEAKKKEEAKKEKNKDKRNFKQEAIEEHTLSELHAKELEREKAKLENIIKLRKSYVSKESLQILQKEFERHQQKNRPSLLAEEKQREKLVKEKDIIKSRIDFLNAASRDMERDSERKLKDAKLKGDDLVKDKLASDKVLNETTYKYNEYLRVFPDHERKKEEAKNEEKKRKQEQREKAKQQQQVRSVERKKREQESLIEKSLQQDPNETSWQQWDKWDKDGNLSKKDNSSIFSNKQFQLAAAAIAVISIVVLSFS